MTTLDPRKDRTAVRLLLYENGFTPLPNHNKACFLPGWNRIEVTPEEIVSRQWARSSRDRDTGIRGGDVVAIDWDIDDAETLNALLDAVVAAGVIAESRFVRIGKPPRELWVYRTSGKIGKRTTGLFDKLEPGADDKAEQVEILGAGCQFAAYGQRSEDIAYTWPDQSLLDHKYMELPEITPEQVETLVKFCVTFFEARGLVRKSPLGGTDGGYTHVNDLTPEMVFPVRDIGDMTVAEMDAYLIANPEDVLRCSVETFRPTSGSWAGMASLIHGHVCISDHGSYTTHFLAGVEPNDDEAMSRLGALLALLHPRTDTEPLPDGLAFDPREDLHLRTTDRFDVNFARALKRYVYVTQDDTIVDLTLNAPGVKLPHWRNIVAPYLTSEPGARGKVKNTHLWECWMQSPQRRQAHSARMRPDMPYPLYAEDGEVHINTYRPVNLPSTGDPRLGIDLIANLLPVNEERAYVLQWLSYKVQNPDVRGPAIVMVAHASYGTGRGSLVELLRTMFSPGLVRTIDFDTLTGKGTQSQYNDWLADSVLVAINEAQETTQNLSRWQTRSNAYEHLKTVVDPGGHDLYIKRKTFNNYQGRTSASILVMTNHMDSLVIPENDRRFYVVENGKPMGQDYWDRFHAWLADRANVGAFIQHLKRDIPLAGYNPYAPPPMTRAKHDMVDAGASALDRAVKFVLDGFPGALLVKEQVFLALEDYLVRVAVEFPEDWRHAAERIFVRATRTPPGADTLVLDGRERSVRQLFPTAEPLLDAGAVRAEVEKNGPLVRAIKSSGTVVAFAQR